MIFTLDMAHGDGDRLAIWMTLRTGTRLCDFWMLWKNY